MLVNDQTPDRSEEYLHEHALNFTKYASSVKLGVYNYATIRYKLILNSKTISCT